VANSGNYKTHDQQQSVRSGWMTAASITLGIALLVSLTPLFPPGFRQIVMKMFAGVCHQLPLRSPHIDGVQLAVCHRCMGSYWGLPLAAVLFGLLRGLWPFTRKTGFPILLLSVVPAGIDWFGDVMGWWVNTPATRVITGGIFGLTAGYFFARAIADIMKDRQMKEAEASTQRGADG
jgi:uncharacterized membrane protein